MTFRQRYEKPQKRVTMMVSEELHQALREAQSVTGSSFAKLLDTVALETLKSIAGQEPTDRSSVFTEALGDEEEES